MKKNGILLVVLFICSMGYSQSKSAYVKEIKAYQEKENKEFKNPETSILTEEDQVTFTALEFYPIDKEYKVTASFVRTPNEKPFLMPTTTSRRPEYVKYGEAHFTINGKQLKLNLYQDTAHETQEGYEDYLFLPFTDLTSGDGSYGGGRFIDARIPEGKTIVIDFNKAYNPYCAYNSKYSCPIPPKENDLLVRVEAGVKDYGKH